MPHRAPHGRRWPWLLFALVVVIAGLLAALATTDYARSALLLMQLQAGDHPSHVARLGARNVIETETTIAGPSGSIRARLFAPSGIKDPPALVLVHGIHHLGIDDPRLVRLARAFAGRGILVLTPEVGDLKRYRVSRESIDEIGAAASALAANTGRQVGVMGLSFSGSLALLAAADPRYAPAISTVVTLGAYDDLERVTKFFVTERIALPDGSERTQKAEEYGALVIAYDHVEDFFRPRDRDVARQALQLWLAEQYQAARAQENALSPAGKTILEAFFRYQLAPVKNRLLQEIQADAVAMEQVSPQGKLQALRASVFLLHGSGDEVIPSSEALWLMREIPASHLRRVLITPVLQHVLLNPATQAKSEWQLVSFMAAVFRALQREPRSAAAPTPAQSIGVPETSGSHYNPENDSHAR